MRTKMRQKLEVKFSKQFITKEEEETLELDGK